MIESNLSERKARFKEILKQNKKKLSFLLLLVLIIVSYQIRTINLYLLFDKEIGDYAPRDPDAALFYRYAKTILNTGSFIENDSMRYYPLGFNSLDQYVFLSYFLAYSYKILHFFNSSITFGFVDVIFPAITFGIALIFFYLLVRKLFDFRVALLASAFLTFMPSFLYRTLAGVGDKEALAIVFLFGAFYFFLLALKSKNNLGYLYSILAGIFTSLMGFVWGGVNFIYLVIGLMILVNILLNNFKRRNFYFYALWWLVVFILLHNFLPVIYDWDDFLYSLTIQIPFLALISGFLYLLLDINILNLKERLNKYPLGFFCIFTIFFIGFIIGLVATVYQNISFISLLNFFYSKLKSLVLFSIDPFGGDRWSITVSENAITFVTDLYNSFGVFYLFLVISASVFLFYEIFKDLNKNKWVLTFTYSIFIFLLIFSRYSINSILNGENLVSKFMFTGAFLFFLIIFSAYFILSFYYNKKELISESDQDKEDEKLIIRTHNSKLINYKEMYRKFTNIDEKYTFLLLWFLIAVMSAKSAQRFIFMLVPVTTIFASYLLVKIFDYGLKCDSKGIKFVSLITVFMFLFVPFLHGSLVERAQNTINTAKYTGSSYDQQWQIAMKFVRENTPKDSVFAHWWDYGYWVQTFGERATLSDGGNARGAINHFIGRHLLTGRNRTEALELLKTHNATNLLIVSDEIGKYPAFSSIGSDENYDRYSYIPIFILNPEVKEENETKEIFYMYGGNYILDEDFIYNGKLFPRGESIIKGAILVTDFNEINTTNLKSAEVFIIYNSLQESVPLNCVYLGGKEYNFGSLGYNGCLRVIPVVSILENVNYAGAALFLSPNTKNTLFTQLYLFNKDEKNNKEWEGFDKIYDDSYLEYSLAYYPDFKKVIGPLKIWRVKYDKKIKTNPDYLRT